MASGRPCNFTGLSERVFLTYTPWENGWAPGVPHGDAGSGEAQHVNIVFSVSKGHDFLTAEVEIPQDLVRMAQREISTPVPAVGTYTGNPVYQFVTYEASKGRSCPGSRASSSIWRPVAVKIRMPASFN